MARKRPVRDKSSVCLASGWGEVVFCASKCPLATRVTLPISTIQTVTAHGILYKMSSRPSYQLIGALLAALAAIGLITWVAWYLTRPAPIGQMGEVRSVAVPPTVQIGGPFSLTDHQGHAVTDEAWRGKLMLIYFGYGYCPDVCPTELQIMSNALDALEDDAERVQPLFISVDPTRDTVEFMADYVSHFHPSMVGLTGSPEAIAKAAKAYRVYYEKVEDESLTDYLVNHSSFIYLMGPDGKFLTMFRAGTDPATMARTIASYLGK